MDKLLQTEVFVMRIRKRVKKSTKVRRAKARVAHRTQVALLKQHLSVKHPSGNILGWYQKRKRADRRIRVISTGKIELFENVYRGDQRRHYFRDLRCGHVFHVSLRELAHGNADQACPYCHPIHDVRRYGSVAALQEYIYQLSHGNILFCAENKLRSADDHYDFNCSLKGIRCKQTFSGFMQNIEYGCPTCHY